MQTGQVIGSKSEGKARVARFQPLTIHIAIPGEGTTSLAVCWAVSAFHPDTFRWLDWSGFAWESDGAGTWSSPERFEYGYAHEAVEVAMRVAS